MKILGPLSTEGAALAVVAGFETFNAYGSLNSSPWTAENFGADPAKAASCRHYVRKAATVSTVMGAGISVISKSAWPLIGVVLVNIYMVNLYERALQKGAVAGSTGWANNPGGNGQ